MIFVFGSNLAGRHGKGAALTARKEHGAVYGVAEGLTGNSYALPTCGFQFEPLPLHKISHFVWRFINTAQLYVNREFQVTRVGCGLGRYTDKDIAPMFANAPADNVLFDEKWKPIFEELNKEFRYWGTF